MSSGKLWGYELFGVEPDMMTLAKPLAGGLPIGAVLMKQHVADAMKPGDHGSTFAGNPLVCHTACTVFDIIHDAAFLKSVETKGERLRAGETMGGPGGQQGGDGVKRSRLGAGGEQGGEFVECAVHLGQSTQASHR